jgi:hypothetical protein
LNSYLDQFQKATTQDEKDNLKVKMTFIFILKKFNIYSYLVFDQNYSRNDFIRERYLFSFKIYKINRISLIQEYF